MIKTCICGKEFESRSKWGDERQFCSRKCANSRFKPSEELKRKISEKLKGRPSPRKGLVKIESGWVKSSSNRICPECGNTTKRNGNVYCSRECANKNRIITDEYRLSQSKLIKEHYKNGRKIYGGSNHVKWYQYKDIKVQGTYELRLCSILDKWKESNFISNWEYTNDRVNYIGTDGEEHTYLLDFKIYTNSNCIFYYEVKGRVQKQDLCKWKSCADKHIDLRVIFLRDIIKFEMKLPC